MSRKQLGIYRPPIYNKGDLVWGKNLESDCYALVLEERDEIVSVLWLYHWDPELSGETTSAFVDNLRPFNNE